MCIYIYLYIYTYSQRGPRADDEGGGDRGDGGFYLNYNYNVN